MVVRNLGALLVAGALIVAYGCGERSLQSMAANAGADDAGAEVEVMGGAPGTAGESGSASSDVADAHGGQEGEATSGGVGGSPDEPEACSSTADVLFLIPHDSGMFDHPSPEHSYLMMAKEALVGPEGELAAFQGRLQMGGIFFADRGTCPSAAYAKPGSAVVTDIADYFDQLFDSREMWTGPDYRSYEPVKDAVEYAADQLEGNNRHVVLLTTGFPDTCADGPDYVCLTDPTVRALQDAYAKGITTHVIGLGDAPDLDHSYSEYETPDSYERYLAQLANAGSGQPVRQLLEYPSNSCALDGVRPVAAFSDSSGTGSAYQAKSAADIALAVRAILGSICAQP